jgi:hypothetical protein
MNNLVYIHELLLEDALLGGSIHIETLDNRNICIACPEIVSPTYKKVVPGMFIFLCLVLICM